LVVGLISQMNMEQLKATWESLKTAFTAIWKFLEPIVTTIWTWVSDTAIPALVDGFVNIFTGIGDLFTKLTARFKGFTEMSWVERMWAIFGAFKDIGSFLGDMIGNFAVTVEKMFGGDGTWITGIWKSIKGFFNSIWDWIKLLFTDPVAALDALIMGTASMLTDFGGWLYRTMIVPLVDWFGKTFKFGSMSEALTSMLKMIWMPIKLFKEWLIDPIVTWLGDMLGFDTTGFTSWDPMKMIGDMIDDISEWFGKLLDIDIGQWVIDMASAIPGGGWVVKQLGGGGDDEPKKTKKQKIQERAEKKEALKRTVEEKKKEMEDNKGTIFDNFANNFRKRGIIEAAEKELKKIEAAEATEAKLAPKETNKKIKTKRNKRKREEKIQQGKSNELAQIKADEGFEEGVYEDTMGIKTIGYGFNLERAGSQEALDAAGIKKSLADLKGGNANLTEEEASRLMQGEMGHFKGVAERYVGSETWKKLSPDRQGILTNMAYNMGEGTLKQFSNLRSAIQKGDWKQAQAEMKDSAWAKQVKGRADRLVARMGGAEKSQALGTAQTGYTAATSQGGQPIYVTKNTIDKSTNVNKGGDTHQHPTGATSDMGSGKQGDLKTV
jgi:lysozyme